MDGIDWAAVGALLSGIGSMLSGYVAIKLARKVTVHIDREEERKRETVSGDGGGT